MFESHRHRKELQNWARNISSWSQSMEKDELLAVPSSLGDRDKLHKAFASDQVSFDVKVTGVSSKKLSRAGVGPSSFPASVKAQIDVHVKGVKEPVSLGERKLEWGSVRTAGEPNAHYLPSGQETRQLSSLLGFQAFDKVASQAFSHLTAEQIQTLNKPLDLPSLGLIEMTPMDEVSHLPAEQGHEDPELGPTL